MHSFIPSLLFAVLIVVAIMASGCAQVNEGTNGTAPWSFSDPAEFKRQDEARVYLKGSCQYRTLRLAAVGLSQLPMPPLRILNTGLGSGSCTFERPLCQDGSLLPVLDLRSPSS